MRVVKIFCRKGLAEKIFHYHLEVAPVFVVGVAAEQADADQSDNEGRQREGHHASPGRHAGHAGNQVRKVFGEFGRSRQFRHVIEDQTVVGHSLDVVFTRNFQNG